MNQCVCRVFGIFLVVFLYTAFTVEGADVAHGSACTAGTDTCIGTGTYACISSQCECATTFFRNTADDACLAKVALDGTCAAGEPADQCTDSNAECTSTTCSCKTNYFKDNSGVCQTQVAALEGACTTAETATDQCAIADSECRTDQCLCKATHYKNGAACTARIAPEEDCTGDQCVEHATCDTTCKCDAGYTASPATNPTMCSGVAKFASLSYMYVVPILVSTMSLLR